MNWTELLRAEPALASPAHHAEALTRLAARCLREGDAATAWRLLDRRLRSEAPPAASERALAALAAHLAGAAEASASVLATARGADLLDPAVGLIALRLAETANARREAAETLLASPLAPDDALRTALVALYATGVEAAARLDLCDGRLSGWVAWRGEPPVLVLGNAMETTAHALDAEPEPGFAPPGTSVAFPAFRSAGPADRFQVLRNGLRLATGRLGARSSDRQAGSGRAVPDQTPDAPALRIVMPVFGDPEATANALRAAIGEARRHPGTEIVAVDDASPDVAIRRLLDMLAARGWIELRRNTTNLGFTGAVSHGLDALEGRDALILNSDTILPGGAIGRLRAAAYGAPDIGSVTPLSNNGEWTSLPRLGHPAPLLSPLDAADLDAAARAAAAAPVDLPNGIGFALWLRHDALAAAGGFSALYERGYFEDAELTLRIRQAGWRNVAATDLVVPHHGSRSFGADKALLVARNLRRLRRRCPGLQDESAAFRLADPLRPARAAIERRQPPTGHPLLLVAPAGSALAAERLRRHATLGRAVVTLRWRFVGASLRAALRGDGHAAPQSLEFDLPGETARLADWLRRLDPERIELAGASAPAPLAKAIVAAGSAVSILAGDLTGSPGSSPTLLAGFEAWTKRLSEGWLEVVASDRATLATLHERLRASPDAARIAVDLSVVTSRTARAGEHARLAVLMGVPSPRSLRFALQLGVMLRRRLGDARCVVFGTSSNDGALMRGGVDPGGAIGDDPAGDISRWPGIRALVLPPPDPSLALFERVTAGCALPRARLDWSDGAEPTDPSTLLLARSSGEHDTIRAIVDWFAGRLAP